MFASPDPELTPEDERIGREMLERCWLEIMAEVHAHFQYVWDDPMQPRTEIHADLFERMRLAGLMARMPGGGYMLTDARASAYMAKAYENVNG